MATSPGPTTNRLFPLFLLAILALFLFIQTASAAISSSTSASPISRNVYDTIRKDGHFKSLLGEIHSDFSKIVSSKDITAFAVVDSAWTTDAFPEDEVRYFFAEGKNDISLIANQTILPTYLTLESLGNASQQLRITKNETGIFVNDVIVNRIIPATNGYVYVLEKFIYPPKKISQVLADQFETSIFAAMIEAGQFSQKISPVTGFVPSNSAFTPINRIIAYYLMRPEARKDLIQVISTHFVPGLIYSSSFNNANLQYPTMNNGSAIHISFDSESTKIVLNGTSFGVVQKDFLAEDGVIQTIDGLMIPSNVQFNLRKLLLGLNATSFLYAVNVTGLDYLLSDSSEVTIFAPENEKFDKLVDQISLDMLKKIVLYHFVNMSITSEQVESLAPFTALQGDNIRISKDSDGDMDINNIYVTYSDITVPSVQGVIHSIAGVLTPPVDVSTVLSQISNSSIFWDLWKLANITNEEILPLPIQSISTSIDKNTSDITNGSISDSKRQKLKKNKRRSALRKRDLVSSESDSFVVSADTVQTILAPQNSAFNSIPSELMNFLTSSSPDAKMTLRKILLNHIIPNVTLSYPHDFVSGDRYTSLSGDDISFHLSDEFNGTILINEIAQVTESNYIAKNGVVHLIDAVLIPNLNFNLIHILTGANLNLFVAQIEKNQTLYAKLSSNSSVEKYTVFAPTNEAMESADLTQFDPSYYIIENQISSSDFEDHQLLDTLYCPQSLQGESQKLQILINNSTTVNGVSINTTDLNASNGVVHITNGIIPVPKTFTEIVFDPSSGFTKFAQLLGAFDNNTGSLLTQRLKDTKGLSMFIPTDAAFEKMGSTLFSYLISKNPISESDLFNLVLFHANKVDDDNRDILYAKNIPNGQNVKVDTLNEREIMIHNSLNVNSTEYSGYHLTINNNISIVNPDILTAEGVIHAIDTVIIPKELLDVTSLRALVGFGDTSVVSLLEQNSMDNMFDGSDSSHYTIFAPTNDAFARLETASHVNMNDMRSILELHILKGSFYTINPGDFYNPIINSGYILLGGEGGNSIICVNMTYYNSQHQEIDRVNVQDLMNRTNRVHLLREIRKMDVLTPGSAYRANILRKEVTTTGVVYEIDAVLGLHGSSANAGKWIILGLVVATLAVVLAVGLWLYRKHQQQIVEATSPVRLLD